MPLARILTLAPEQADDLAQQLYDLGFEVEVVSPHEHSLSPADLEIEFAICDQQQILARAAAIATQLRSEVVVFPKAIPPLPKPIPTVDLEKEFTEPVLLPEEDRVSEAPIEISPEHPSGEHILQYESQPPALNQAPDEHLDVAVKPPSALRQWAQTFRENAARIRPRLFGDIARMKMMFSAMAGAVAHHVRKMQESVKLRLAEAQANRERRMAEMRKQEAEAALLAAALDQERQRQAQVAATEQEQEREREAALAVAMQQQELQHLRTENQKMLEEIERLRQESKEHLAALELAQHAVEQPQTQTQPSFVAKPEATKSVLGRARQLRGALAGAVAAALLFVVGMVLANFQSLAPLSHDLNNGSIEQEVPFGATTVHGPPGVTVGGQNAAKPSPASAQSQAPPQTEPQPVRTAPVPAKPSPEWHHFRRSSADNGTNGTDDVVVRHFGQPRATTQTAQQRAGIKRYSDQ